MEYMNNGYRKAQKLRFRTGGSNNRWSKGSYTTSGNSSSHVCRIMENLLVQNICICVYEKAKTITEISSELGVAADYIENLMDEMLEYNILTQSANKYQTNFPIFSKKDCDITFLENYYFAQKSGQKIYDVLISLKNAIKNIGFYGSNKDFSNLIPLIILTCKENCKKDINFFDLEKIPFKAIDSTWYILGTTEESFMSLDIPHIGLNRMGKPLDDGISECFTSTGDFPDCRNDETAKLFVNLLSGEAIDYDKESYNLAKLVEEEKIVKTSDGYKANVPAFTFDEYKKFLKVLAPVLEIYTDIGRKLIERSTETVKAVLLNRFKKGDGDVTEFFGGYCANGSIESALFNIFKISENGNKFTRDMTSWYVYK